MNDRAFTHKYRLLSAVLAAVLFAVLVMGCSPRVYELEDPTNERGMSYWTSMPYVTAEARALGYSGSETCQHLTSIERGTVNKNLLFFGTDAAGVCRSTDGGKTWIPRNKGMFTSGVSMIEIDPKNDDHVVAINATSSENISKYTALFYSEDGGDNWIKSDGTRGIGFSASHYYYDTLEFDPRSYDPVAGICTDVYFATPAVRDPFASLVKNSAEYLDKRGMYRSTDGGKSFAKIPGSDELTDGIIVINDSRIAVANMNGIFTLSGDKYTKKSSMNVHSFLYVSNKYYIMTEEGIYTSTDLNNYTKITNDGFFADREPRNLAVSECDNSYMVLFARKHIGNKYSNRPYYSHDGGKTWTLTEPQATEELFYYYTYHAGTFTFDPDDKNVILGIIGGEVIKSTDGGASFYYHGSGINNVSAGGQFHFNIYDEDLVYIGAYDFGGALTTDGGYTWKNVSLSKDWDGRDIMGAYAADRDTLIGVYVDTWSPSDYFRDYRYVCFSHDGGETSNINSSVIKEAPDTYAALNVDHSVATGHESSYQSPNNRKILFCANYRSTDNGYNWTNMLDATVGEKCLQVYTHNGKTLYGCSRQSGFVLRSDNDGKTWKKVNQTELTKWKPSSPSHITDIAVDSVNGYIYAAYGDKLFRMNMDGEDIKDLTATMKRDNFNTFRIRSVAIDPNLPQVVYCCGSGDFYMSCESVRRSCDFGETWSTMTPSGSESSIVNDNSSLGFEGRYMRVRSDGLVWCVTLCLGVCTLTPPYTM